MSWVNTKLRKVDYHIDWKTFKMTGTSFMFNYAKEDVLSILGLELCRWRYLLALYGWRCRLKQIQKSKKLPRDAKPATKTQIHWILTSDIKLKPLFCWVIAIACTANGWHQPLTIGSHHFQWLGNLPCLTLQPCLTAEQVKQLPWNAYK